MNDMCKLLSLCWHPDWSYWPKQLSKVVLLGLMTVHFFVPFWNYMCSHDGNVGSFALDSSYKHAMQAFKRAFAQSTIVYEKMAVKNGEKLHHGHDNLSILPEPYVHMDNTIPSKLHSFHVRYLKCKLWNPHSH